MKKGLFIVSLSVLLAFFLLVFCGCDMTEEGRTIRKTQINEKGELIITYTDGFTENLGVVVGRDGVDGIDGVDGVDGKDGKDGKDGIDGIDGVDGKDGTDGVDGINGKDGEIIISGEGQSISLAASLATRSAVSIVGDFGSGIYSAGSGVIYKYIPDEQAYFIITNYHVVYDADYGLADSINVMFYGNEYSEGAFPADYVGGSSNYDIAILRVDFFPQITPSAVPVTIADSNQVSIGDTAIAVGNARGDGISITVGVVSVDSETIEMVPPGGKTTVKFRVMRTDAPINKGNSGGGIFNDHGELIGIANAKIIMDGVEGFGYAIPSVLACNVADNIIDNCYYGDNKYMQRALLGITVAIKDSVSRYDPITGKISIVETNYVHELAENNLFGDKLKVNDIIKSLVLDGKEPVVATRQFHIIDYLLQARLGDTGTLVVERRNPETGEYEEVHLTFEITEASIVDYA